MAALAPPGGYDQVARRRAFEAAHPRAEIRHAGRDWHGSLPVAGRRLEAGPSNDLRELLGEMERLAALAADAEAIGAEFPGWRPWLSDAGDWWATRRRGGYRDPMTVYAGSVIRGAPADAAALRKKLADVGDAEARRAAW